MHPETLLRYKGYTGVAEVDFEAGVISGRVVGLLDVIAFEGRTAAEAADDFRAMIDLYLDQCAREGKEPEAPYSGRFNVRIDPRLHRDLAHRAAARGMSLNDLVIDALTAAVGADAEAAPPPSAPTWREVKADLLARKREAEASRDPAARPAREARAPRRPRARATGAK